MRHWANTVCPTVSSGSAPLWMRLLKLRSSRPSHGGGPNGGAALGGSSRRKGALMHSFPPWKPRLALAKPYSRKPGSAGIVLKAETRNGDELLALAWPEYVMNGTQPIELVLPAQ